MVLLFSSPVEPNVIPKGVLGSPVRTSSGYHINANAALEVASLAASSRGSEAALLGILGRRWVLVDGG